MEQGSSDWKAWRKKGIGSSDIATIIGKNPYRDVVSLWMEKTGKAEPEDLSGKYAVQRGTALEPFARNLFNLKMGMNFQPAVFTHKEYDFMRYSSDGFDHDANEIIEVKCLGKKNTELVLATKAPPDYYIPQMQWACMISGAPICHFISYNPSYPEPLFTVPIYADLEYFDFIEEAAHKFWECVQKDIRPDW